jgi:hypothetical protein
MKPNLSQMDTDQEVSVLEQILKDESFYFLDHPECKSIISEGLSDNVTRMYIERSDDEVDDATGLTNELFDTYLSEIVNEFSISAILLAFDDLYLVVKNEFNNQILESWVQSNPELAFPITLTEIENHPKVKSISDDDICSTCEKLLYCPGEESLCSIVKNGRDEWPALFDSNNYAIECESYKKVECDEGNYIPLTAQSGADEYENL